MQEGAQYAMLAGARLQERHQRVRVHMHMREGTHGGLDGLGVVKLHTVGRADDVADAAMRSSTSSGLSSGTWPWSRRWRATASSSGGVLRVLIRSISAGATSVTICF